MRGILKLINTNRLKEKGWEKINYANSDHKRDEVVLLNIRLNRCEAETYQGLRCFIMMRGSIQRYNNYKCICSSNSFKTYEAESS